MTTEGVRFGVIAVGGIGSLHATNIARRVPGARLIAVTDIDQTRARVTAQELSADLCSSSAALFDRSDIDAVVIASPTSTHYDLTIEAVKAGKHVLCEKPLAGEIEATGEIIAAVQASNQVVQVGFQRRHDPDWRAAADRLHSGDVGAPRLYFSSYREREPIDDLLRDLLIHGNIHDLDAARWMVGEIDEISVIVQTVDGTTVAAGGQVENLVTTLRFANGAIGVIDNGTNARFGFECRAEIVGSEATLRIANREMEGVEILREGFLAKPYPADSAERFDRAYVNLVADFCAVIRGDQARQGASVFDGRAALVLALAAERSVLTGKRVRLDRLAEAPYVEYRILD